MKHENSFGMSRPALPLKSLIGGFAAVALLGLSLNAQAQTCVVENWDTQTGLTNANAGVQDGDNRRYGGPCGLRVPGGGVAYVTDESPTAEGSYIARFYAYLDDAGSAATIIYEATDGTDARAQVWYNFPNAGDLTLRVADNSLPDNDLTFAGIGPGWHSIEFVWEAAASADIRFSLNGSADAEFGTALDTSGFQISDASLGNVNGAATGPMDFDDFDSRRISRPGRLVCGDADDDSSVSVSDLSSVRSEIFGTFAPGQPDANEDGAVSVGDLSFIRAIIFGLEAC